jgi:predicted  nucleic acid-binding Zn-ribbon protein
MANNDALLNELQFLNKRLDGFEHGQNTLAKGLQRLEGKMDEAEKNLSEKIETVDRKVEAVHAYQQQAHTEIIERLFESNEASGQEQQRLEKRIERIEKHSDLPPLK